MFKALADPTRRYLLDLLFERDGRTLTELESELTMTRFGVMKHLKVLEDASLVVTRKEGREKLHFLNAVPIRLVHDRWVGKYAEAWAAEVVPAPDAPFAPDPRLVGLGLLVASFVVWRLVVRVRRRRGDA